MTEIIDIVALVQNNPLTKLSSNYGNIVKCGYTDDITKLEFCGEWVYPDGKIKNIEKLLI